MRHPDLRQGLRGPQVQLAQLRQRLELCEQFIRHDFAGGQRDHAACIVDRGEEPVVVKWLQPLGQMSHRSYPSGLERGQDQCAITDFPVHTRMSLPVNHASENIA